MATKHFCLSNGNGNKSFRSLHKENSKRFTLIAISVADKKKRDKNWNGTSKRVRVKKETMRTVPICCKCVQEYYITKKLNAISNKIQLYSSCVKDFGIEHHSDLDEM